MALKSKVLNVGEETFEAEVNGTKYKIKAGDSITVNRRTAVALRGVYTPKERKVSLKIEHIPGEANVFACHFCGVEFPNKDVLDKHLKTHSANLIADPDTPKETEKIYIAPDGQEFKSKAALMSHLRAAAATPKDK
jgi:hypothetical protein